MTPVLQAAFDKTTETAKELLLTVDEFQPQVIFIFEDKAEGTSMAVPLPDSWRLFEPELKPHMRSIMQKVYEGLRPKEGLDLLGIFTVSDAFFTTYITSGEDKDADDLIKEYGKGGIPKPSSSPHRVEALIVGANTPDENTMRIVTYDRDARGKPCNLQQQEDGEMADGNLAKLFPKL